MRHSVYGKKSFPAKEQIDTVIGVSLTKQEYMVLEEMWKGHKNQEIAENIGLSINTIKTHISNIYLKLDVHNRGAALAKIRSMI